MLRYLDPKFYGQSINVGGILVQIAADGYVRHAIDTATMKTLLAQPAFWVFDENGPAEIVERNEATEAEIRAKLIQDALAGPPPEIVNLPMQGAPPEAQAFPLAPANQPETVPLTEVKSDAADEQMAPNAALPPQSPVIAEPAPLTSEEPVPEKRGRGRAKKVVTQ